MPTKRQSWIIWAMLLASAAYCAVSAFAATRHADPAPASALVWLLAFSVLVMLWAREDRREPSPPPRSEYSWLLMFFFWPVVLAYHLVKSRGLEGFILYLGFVAIYLAPNYVRWVAWVCCSGVWTTTG